MIGISTMASWLILAGWILAVVVIVMFFMGADERRQ